MAERKLPELVSRLRLDTSSLDSAHRRIAGFLASTNDPKALAGYEASLRSVGNRADEIGSKLTRNLTLPIAAAGAVSIKLASDFNTTFTKMQNLAGVAAGEVAGLKGEVTDLAKETAQSPTELAAALYQIRSSGLTGSAALDALDASAKAAAIGMGTASNIADALTSAVNAYGAENLSATEAANALTTAVKLGKGEASEFAPQLGRLLPLAENLGIGFDELAGSLSYMTLVGGDTAQASTQLQGILQNLLRPSQMGAKALEAVGLSTEQLRKVVADQGLVAALKLVDDRLGNNQESLARVFEDTQAVVGVFQLLRNGGTDAAGVIDQVSLSNESLAESFARLQGTDEFKAQQAITELQVAAIELGQKLIPIMADVADGVIGLVEAFNSLPEPIQKGLLGMVGLAAVAGPLAKVLSLTTGGVSLLLKVASSKSLDGFRLGLLGLVEAGGGAGNATGGLVAKLGGLGVVAPVVAIGVAAIGAALLDYMGKAERAKEDTNELLAAMEAGIDPIDAFNEKLAKTLADVEGGFAMDVRGDLFRGLVDQAGLSLEELSQLLTGSQADFDAFIAGLSESDPNDIVLSDALAGLRKRGLDVIEQGKELAANREELGLATDDATGAVEGLTDAELEQLGISTDLTNATQEQADAARALFDANQAATASADRVVKAQEDLAAAQATANGTSDEAVRAREAIADAERGLADAQEASREAQEGLTEARKEAAENLEDLALAASGAQADEQSAAAALARAKSDLLKAKTPLDKQEAEAAIAQAQQALAEAKDKTGDSAAELAEARQKGIEGSDAVVAAQDRITDAREAEREAQSRLGDATKASAKLQSDAAEKVTDANRNLIEAELDHVDALADVASANGDAKGATDILLYGLETISQKLAPNDPLRKNLRGYIEDLREMAGLSGTAPTSTSGGTTSLGSTAPPGLVNAERGGRSVRVPTAPVLPSPTDVTPPSGAAVPNSVPGGRLAPEIKVDINVTGQPDAQTLAQLEEVATRGIAKALREAAVA